MCKYPMSSFLIIFFIFCSSSAYPWTQGYVKYGKNNFIHLSPNKFWNNGLNREPNCDELRAMWRFSMVKSRKTEITNEIPTYRDPFAYNIWEPHTRSKHLESSMQGTYFRGPNAHVYGKLVHTVPKVKSSEQAKVNGRGFDSMAKFLTSDKTITPRGKNAEAYRLPSGEVSFKKLPTLSDSFRRLKAVVRAQKAKELHDQQMSQQPFSHDMMKDVKSDGTVRSKPSFEYLYSGNNSMSGKRNSAGSRSHFIPNPSFFIPGVSRYYDPFLPEQYAANYGYYHKANVRPMNMQYGVYPANSLLQLAVKTQYENPAD